MKRTKFLGIAFSVLVITSCFSTTVFADNTPDELDTVSIDSAIQEHDAYIASNLESLIEEQAGVEMESLNENEDLYFLDSDSPYIIKDYHFTEEVYDAGIEKIMADVTLVQITDVSAVSPYSGGSNLREGTDNTGSVTLYSTIYFRQKTVDHNVYDNFYQASGGYKSLDSGTQVASQSVDIGAAGASLDDPYVSKTINRYPTTSFWQYNTGFTDYLHDPTVYMGIHYTVTLKRSTSTWTYTFSNKY